MEKKFVSRKVKGQVVPSEQADGPSVTPRGAHATTCVSRRLRPQVEPREVISTAGVWE